MNRPGVNCPGVNCPGVNCPGVNCPDTAASRDTKTANESIISQIDMTTVIIAICDFFQIPSCQHNYIIELYSISHIFHKFE